MARIPLGPRIESPSPQGQKVPPGNGALNDCHKFRRRALVGQLAESWEASADVATWTFQLRKGVTYHDAREVTAEDVIASINHHRGEKSKSAAKPIIAPVTDMQADGKHTVVITLEAGNTDFPFLLSDYHVPVNGATIGDRTTGDRVATPSLQNAAPNSGRPTHDRLAAQASHCLRH